MNEQAIEQAYAYMTTLAPALKRVNKDQVIGFLTLATAFVCEHRFGSKYYMALALYTMHCMFLDGALKEESEGIEEYSRRVSSFSLTGEFSQTFAAISTSDTNQLTSTPWGKMYRTLLMKSGGGFGLIAGLRRSC
ncbi:DUF4054 domain-containing protein [Gibbsiella quercinecans]|uniref:DUF4054 domain-containing protein n=1 Tax=Gibbsiella quercinecans TaxID=929813 RepID=UPI00242F1ADE|nr:DUF4054 domain-containing protein [Gibbsiella quercinecans]